VSPAPPSGSGRREVAAYLRASSAPLQAAIEAQRDLRRDLAPIYAQADEGRAAAERAVELGRGYGRRFRALLERCEQLAPPSAAARGDEYLRRWLRFLVMACDALAGAPPGGDGTYLGDCRDYLDDARYAARSLSTMRQRLREAAAGPSSGGAAKPPRATLKAAPSADQGSVGAQGGGRVSGLS
jgi:hypothetical protein